MIKNSIFFYYIRYFLVFLLLFPFVAMGNTLSNINLWSLMATQDLNSIHQIIAESDPATAGYATREFTQWYEPGFKQSLKMAEKVNSYAGYFAALRFYTNGFNSEHLNVNSLLNQQKINWPGFIVALRNGNYTVVYQQNEKNELPAINAVLVSCDAITPNELMIRNLLPFTDNGYVRIQTTWASYVPDLFFDTGNPWYTRIRSCIFREQGKEKTYQLHWQSVIAAPLTKIASHLAFGPVPDFAIRNIGDNGIWISIPTFQPGEISKDQVVYDSLMKIVNSISSFRNKNVIVFDLRGNSGGNASFSRAILRNLYGDDFISSLSKYHSWNQPWTAALRVSAANIKLLQQVGENTIVEQMKSAAKQGKANIIVTIMTPQQQPKNVINNPVKAKVFLLTDGVCGSDCWLFVRDFLQMPNTELIGQPTHFMTRYTMANAITLPSGIMVFNVPMQAFIKPLDHFDKPFIPRCIYTGYMGDTATIEKWVLQLVSHEGNCS